MQAVLDSQPAEAEAKPKRKPRKEPDVRQTVLEVVQELLDPPNPGGLASPQTAMSLDDLARQKPTTQTYDPNGGDEDDPEMPSWAS